MSTVIEIDGESYCSDEFLEAIGLAKEWLLYFIESQEPEIDVDERFGLCKNISKLVWPNCSINDEMVSYKLIELATYTWDHELKTFSGSPNPIRGYGKSVPRYYTGKQLEARISLAKEALRILELIEKDHVWCMDQWNGIEWPQQLTKQLEDRVAEGKVK